MVHARNEEDVRPFTRLIFDKLFYRSLEHLKEVSHKSLHISSWVLNTYLIINDLYGGIYRKCKGTRSHNVINLVGLSREGTGVGVP